MTVYFHERGAQPITRGCEAAARLAGWAVVDTPVGADLAAAPYLERLLLKQEYSLPRLGTLIFHPSLLPRLRGRDAIKRAFKLGLRETGATWFWCEEKVDAGDICEQIRLEIPAGCSPRAFYVEAMVPAAVALFKQALISISRGTVRRVPQAGRA